MSTPRKSTPLRLVLQLRAPLFVRFRADKAYSRVLTHAFIQARGMPLSASKVCDNSPQKRKRKSRKQTLKKRVDEQNGKTKSAYFNLPRVFWIGNAAHTLGFRADRGPAGLPSAAAFLTIWPLCVGCSIFERELSSLFGQALVRLFFGSENRLPKAGRGGRCASSFPGCTLDRGKLSPFS